MTLYLLKVIFSLMKDFIYALQKVLTLFIIFSIVLNELIFHFRKVYLELFELFSKSRTDNVALITSSQSVVCPRVTLGTSDKCRFLDRTHKDLEHVGLE